MASRKIFRLNHLTGGVNTVAEENSLNTFDPMGVGIGAEARDIENFLPINRGGQTKVSGFSLLKTVGSDPITGLYRFIRSNGDTFFLITSGTKLYKLVGDTLTELYNGLANNASVHFETALDRCILCDGQNVPVVFDGTSVTTLGGSPPAGAIQSLFYQNRLWLAGGNNPSLLYYSDPGVLTSGYASQFVQCDENDGQRITALEKFFIPGDLEPVILVGKSRSVGLVQGDGTTANPFTFVKINRDAGIPAPRQAVQVGQNIVYLTPQGVSSLQTDRQAVNLHFAYVSDKVRSAFLGLNPQALSRAHGWYDALHQRVTWAVPEAGQSWPNVLWHFDVRLECWYKERWAFGQTCTASWVDSDGTWYHGDHAGRVYRHDAGINAFDGQPISAVYQTPFLDFGAPNQMKRIHAARLVLRGNGTYGLGVSTRLDYGSRIGRSVPLTLQTSAYSWGAGQWTTDAGAYQWAGPPIRTLTFYPSGVFRSIQFTLTQSGANQPLDLFELEFDVTFCQP